MRNHLPVRQRTKAGEAWLRLAIDEEQVHPFVTTTTIDPNIHDGKLTLIRSFSLVRRGMYV